jgi:PKD repeat protein
VETTVRLRAFYGAAQFGWARANATIWMLFLLSAGHCFAGQVTLVWDRNTEPYLGGYFVKYGRASGSYTSSIDVGLKNQHTVTGLTAGVRYYFAVVAYDKSRKTTSRRSNEVNALTASAHPAAPSASFTAQPTQGLAPLTVRFTNTSAGTISSYSWDFGDGIKSSLANPTHRYNRPGAYTVRLVVTGPGGSHSSTRQGLIRVSAPSLKIQWGEEKVDHNWVRVGLIAAKQFKKPIVVAKPHSEKGAGPALVRIDRVDLTGFDLSVQEWDYEDSQHVLETVGYLVIEQGSHILPNGARVEANRFTSPGSTSFRSIKFRQPFGTTPVVVLAVTTRNGADAVTTRLRNVTRYGFEYRLQEQESNSYVHVSETVSYVAWGISKGVLNGVRYEVNRIGRSVTDRFWSIVFRNSFRRSPVLIGDMQSANDLDPASLVHRNKTSTAVQVRIQEERSLSSNVTHAAESVGYILLER